MKCSKNVRYSRARCLNWTRAVTQDRTSPPKSPPTTAWRPIPRRAEPAPKPSMRPKRRLAIGVVFQMERTVELIAGADPRSSRGDFNPRSAEIIPIWAPAATVPLGNKLICSGRPRPYRIVGGGIAGWGAGSPGSEAAATLTVAESRTLHAQSSATPTLVSRTCDRAKRVCGSPESTKTPPRGDIRQPRRASCSAPEAPRLTADRVRGESGRHTERTPRVSSLCRA